MSENKPLVSACIITYNHEEFISECIEGAVKQELDYPYEIVIGEDFSTDNTRAICEAYVLKYPNLIRFVERNENLGMCENWAETIKACNGKYIALCEGDDYWSDPLKLQKQVSFLEANEEYVICAHKCDIQREGKLLGHKKKQIKEDDFKNHLINGLSAETLSVVFRKNDLSFPDWYFKCEMADYPLYVLLTIKGGKIKYLDENMGCYRMHKGGVWSSLSLQKMGEKGIKTFEIVDEGLDYKYHRLLQKAIVKRKRKFGLFDYKFGEVLNGTLPLSFYFQNKFHKTVKRIKEIVPL